jgi:hypothetical protein
MLFTELTEEEEDGTFTDNALELRETVFLCAISTCAIDGAIFVGKISTCFDFEVAEGPLKSSEDISGYFEESSPPFDNTFEGILVDGIFFGCISVHVEVTRAFLVNTADCFGLNACMVGVWNRCILVFSPVHACSLVLDVSGTDVCKLKKKRVITL